MLDTICSPEERTRILYLWKNNEHLLKRNKFIGDQYNQLLIEPTEKNLIRVMVANYILEGVYFYSGFMFFYNLGRMGKMPGTVQEIRYINRDENTHLWLFRNAIAELQKERPDLFTDSSVEEYREMLKEGIKQEIDWGKYILGDSIPGLNESMVEDYIKYLGNLRARGLNLGNLYDKYDEEPESMSWISQYSNANMVKTDFFEARSTAYAKSTALTDDLYTTCANNEWTNVKRWWEN